MPPFPPKLSGEDSLRKYRSVHNFGYTLHFRWNQGRLQVFLSEGKEGGYKSPLGLTLNPLTHGRFSDSYFKVL